MHKRPFNPVPGKCIKAHAVFHEAAVSILYSSTSSSSSLSSPNIFESPTNNHSPTTTESSTMCIAVHYRVTYDCDHLLMFMKIKKCQRVLAMGLECYARPSIHYQHSDLGLRCRFCEQFDVHEPPTLQETRQVLDAIDTFNEPAVKNLEADGRDPYNPGPTLPAVDALPENH